MTKGEKQELEFLRWFYQHADFGPADGDVRAFMYEQYEEDCGPIPKGYELE